MRTNPVKCKLANGQPSFGTWLSLGDIFTARVLARCGFDWLTVDLEHSPIDWSQAGTLFGAIADAGCVPLARVPRGDHDHIKRVLDAGAWGIIAPMVNTVEEAKSIVAACKYPPTGNRSIGGGMHALNFGANSGDYFAKANDEILVVLQTESPLGIQNAREIYDLPGVDAIFVGPNDLRWQMRSSDGAFPTAEQFEQALEQIVFVGKRVGTPTGMHCMTPEDALRRAQQGMQFIAVGSDLRMVAVQAQGWLSVLHPDRPPSDLIRY